MSALKMDDLTYKRNARKAGVFLSYVQTILSGMVSVLFTPFLLRYLSQSTYGVYTLSASIISHLSLLHFGLNSAYLRFYTQSIKEGGEREVASLNGAYLKVYTGIAFLSLCVSFLLIRSTGALFGAHFTMDEVRLTGVLLGILSVNLALTFLTTVFNSYLNAREAFIVHRLLHILRTLLPPLVMLPVLIAGFQAIGMCVVITIVGCLIDCFTILYCIRVLKIRFDLRKRHDGLMRRLFIFSSFIALNSIVDQINWQVDKVILSRRFGTVETAIYGVASQVNMLYISVSSAIANVYAPLTHRIALKEHGRELFQKLFERIGRIQLMLLGLPATGAILFGKRFFTIWAGNAYQGAYPILLLLMLPATIPLIENLGIEYQRARNMHYFRSVLYLCMAVFNVVLSILLSKRYAGVGCAAGTAISILLANGIVMNLYYYKKMELDIPAFLGRILPVLLLIAALLIPGYWISLVTLRLFREIPSFILGTLLYGMLYCGVMGSLYLRFKRKELRREGLHETDL